MSSQVSCAEGRVWPPRCAWCDAPLPPTARADAVTCSQACRQRRHRYQRATGHAARVPEPATPQPRAADPSPWWEVDAAAQVALPGITTATPTVAALYVDRHGPYPRLLGPSMCWPIERDAMGYAGPWPVVAHPPCAPWSVARALATGHDREQGLRAVEQVRRWGGVLEHPAGSTLWSAAAMPRPGHAPDRWGGYTLRVDQGAWGHLASKPTWVYVCRAWVPAVPPHVADPARPGVFDLPATARRRSPDDFARWLISAAATVWREQLRRGA